MWVYQKTDKSLWTVGYWHDKYFSGENRAFPVFEPIADFSQEADARHLVHYLNGGEYDKQMVFNPNERAKP
jgi:hypothetical protein